MLQLCYAAIRCQYVAQPWNLLLFPLRAAWWSALTTSPACSCKVFSFRFFILPELRCTAPSAPLLISFSLLHLLYSIFLYSLWKFCFSVQAILLACINTSFIIILFFLYPYEPLAFLPYIASSKLLHISESILNNICLCPMHVFYQFLFRTSSLRAFGRIRAIIPHLFNTIDGSSNYDNCKRNDV